MVANAVQKAAVNVVALQVIPAMYAMLETPRHSRSILYSENGAERNFLRVKRVLPETTA